MSKPASSDVLGAVLVKALGLPAQTTSLQLSLKPGMPVQVSCTFLAPAQQAVDETTEAALVESVRQYRLVDGGGDPGMTSPDAGTAIDRSAAGEA